MDEVPGNASTATNWKTIDEVIEESDVQTLRPREMTGGAVVTFLMTLACTGVCRRDALPVDMDRQAFPYELPTTGLTVGVVPCATGATVVTAVRRAKVNGSHRNIRNPLLHRAL